MRIPLAFLSLAMAWQPITGKASPSQQGTSMGGGSTARRPNVLMIILDDVGYGQLSPFGGPYRVPNIERLAQQGLRYTNFHTTALCSPTRAALLTGRNHHSVGMATITETASDQPGYTGRIPRNAGTLAHILKTQGYNTYALGKWHLTPVQETGPSGPFSQWPMGMGFDHWYGFHGGDTDQWSPALWDDTQPVEPPHQGPYHLTTDLANHAVHFIEEQANSLRPFFMYFATGAGHAPHQAPKEWIDRNRGRFDEGWDKARQRIFENQKVLGIIPSHATLPPRHDAIKAWDDLTAQEKRLFARMQEVHAGFIEHTDGEIGRILKALEATGKLEDTLIVFTSDNGASGEGGPFGSVNEAKFANGIPDRLEDNLSMIDDLGSPKTFNHYPAGWAQAGNTPFRYWKQETHEGGVRDPLILSWPRKILDHGSIRPQFSHVTDVMPTILEALAIAPPRTLNGLQQKPIEGTSMLPTIADAAAPTAKKVQYSEMLGNRGIWADGWKAVAFHGRLPWLHGVVTLHPFEDDTWELYDTVQDPTESHNLAALYPEKLKELQKLFDEEAKKYQVYPLDDSSLSERGQKRLSQGVGQVQEISYDRPQSRIPEALAPWVKKRSHTITASVNIPQDGAEGVIVAAGGRFGGYALYIKQGKLFYSHNYLAEQTYTMESSISVPVGPVQLRFEFVKMPLLANETRGLGRLYIHDTLVGEAMIERTTPTLYGLSETFDIGSDTVSSVVPDMYSSPFAFSGTIEKVTFKLNESNGGSHLFPNPRHNLFRPIVGFDFAPVMSGF